MPSWRGSNRLDPRHRSNGWSGSSLSDWGVARDFSGRLSVPRLLSLTRAARLVGVQRGALQQMVAGGTLASFDGLIDLDDLQRSFPKLALLERLDEHGLLEKVGKIREQAFARRMREIVLPSQEVLAQRLFRMSVDLAAVQRHLQAYHALVVEIRAKIASDHLQGDWRQPLQHFVDRELQRILAADSDPFEESARMLEAVSAHVTVRPSGRQFLVEGSDSLLQAGLKSGLNLGYGCGTGSCGLCKARVISGELRTIAHADYRLSEHERQQGFCLLCTQTAVTDVIIETLEAGGPQDIPEQAIVGRVRALKVLAPDTLLLHLQTPRTHRLRFLAGQSVTLGYTGPHGDVSESFPLASCPCDERNLQFHVGCDRSGPLTSLLTEEVVKLDDAFDIRGPFGDFVLTRENPRSPVFLACDTAFAPVKSLLEHAMASDEFESLALYWLATRPGGHYLENLCRAWAASLDSFKYVLHSEPSAAAGAKQLVARLLTDRKDLARAAIFIAGPTPFVDNVREVLTRNALKPEQVMTFPN